MSEDYNALQITVGNSSLVYRVEMELSDVDRSVYEHLSIRVALHPSESEQRLVTRILAYALFFEEGLEFGKGLSDADEPALWVHDLTGQLQHWIDVGTPSAERVHAASKRAPRVSILCHKGEDALMRELAKRKVHHADSIQILILEPEFVNQLAAALDRNSSWTVVRTSGQLMITLNERVINGSVLPAAMPQ
jgi:uncharacterized protein YaeQ